MAKMISMRPDREKELLENSLLLAPLSVDLEPLLAYSVAVAVAAVGSCRIHELLCTHANDSEDLTSPIALYFD